MNTLGVVAAEAAYDEREDWLDPLLDPHADKHRHVAPTG